MPRIPTYRLHKPTGQAVVTIGGRDHYLGAHDTPASRENSRASWRSGMRETSNSLSPTPPPRPPPSGRSPSPTSSMPTPTIAAPMAPSPMNHPVCGRHFDHSTGSTRGCPRRNSAPSSCARFGRR